ncbi:MAG: SAV_2336 N-terminal domain-related protein, partial [Blastocatellia bacterium]
MLADFVKILHNAGLELSGTEIADMLIAAAYIPAPAATRAEHTQDERTSSTRPASQSMQPAGEALEPAAAPQTPQTGGVYANTAADDENNEDDMDGVETVPFRAPRAAALPGKQGIARALRPLRRRHPSNRHFVLDEEKTIQAIADGGSPTPLLKPAPERWLDLALVLDHGLSMQLWRPAMTELLRLFEQCGVFRDVRAWRLDTDGPRAILHPLTARVMARPAPAKVDAPGHGWRELIDPAGRRLIAVVSDCHGASWRNGDAYRLLTDLGGKSPVVLMQVLPGRFWPETTMTAVDATLRAYQPGLANERLEINPAWYRDLIRDGGLPLPVVSLEEWSIAPWARMVAGFSGVTPFGLVIPPLPPRAAADTPAPEAGRAITGRAIMNAELPAAERAGAFFATASPMARRLACYIAAAPLCLPVMQLVQRAMV